jgi:hypothetical protein
MVATCLLGIEKFYDSIMIDHRIGFADQAIGLERQQFRVAGAGADERNAAGRGVF